jgi:S1-C subfamily serine protease
MQKKNIVIPVLLVMVALLASACSSVTAALPSTLADSASSEVVEVTLNDQIPAADNPAAPVAQAPVEPGLLAAYENTLTEIYNQVSPSVVNIRVVGREQSLMFDPGQFPDMPDLPE